MTRVKNRLNLLKALRGQTWGASPETLFYSYRTYVRLLLEYSCMLFSYSNDSLLKQIQAVETQAIKIAFRLAPCATNTSCYKLVTFPKILNRIKKTIKTISRNKQKRWSHWTFDKEFQNVSKWSTPIHLQSSKLLRKKYLDINCNVFFISFYPTFHIFYIFFMWHWSLNP